MVGRLPRAEGHGTPTYVSRLHGEVFEHVEGLVRDQPAMDSDLTPEAAFGELLRGRSVYDETTTNV